MRGQTEIVSLQDGNVLHCRNGMINLLFVEEGEQNHFIYLKRLEKLMKACVQTGHQERRFCPYFRTGICCKTKLRRAPYEEALLNNKQLQLKITRRRGNDEVQELQRHADETLHSLCGF
jgi:hypothetical protein